MDSNKAYKDLKGIIHENETKEEIAYFFKTIGADVRKSSWSDFEITDKNYEFEIIGENEILISGEIKLDHFDTFIEDLKDLDLKFTMELYEDNGNEIKTVTNT